MTASPTEPQAEYRAAATDLSERLRSGIARGPVIDLASKIDSGINFADDGAAAIGAFTTIEAIASDKGIAAAYPGLAATAGGLATPQIRHLATLGGNLAQRSRCWYYRNPHIACLKKDGIDCPARRIPRRWPWRYWPMRRPRSTPTAGTACRSQTSSATAATAPAITRFNKAR